MQNYWPIENKNDKANKYICFLINPILGVLYSLKRMNTKSSYRVFFCFILLFGLSLTMESSFYQEDATNGFLDSMFHRADFELTTQLSWDEFLRTIFISYGEFERKDYFDYIVKFLIGQITDNYHIFFLTIAFVFAYFCLKSFRYFTCSQNFSNKYYVYVLAYLFMSIQIIQINGVRFYPTAWMAIYALFKILHDNDKKYLLLLLITPLFHRAFFFLYIILFVVYLTKHKYRFWAVTFFFSIIFAEIAEVLITANINILPGNISEWAQSYIDTKTEFGDGGRLYDVFALAVRFYKYLLVSIMIINAKDFMKDSKTAKIYSFMLITMCITNFSMSISNLGSRFSMLAWPFIAYLWLEVINNRYKWVFYIMPFVYIYKCLYYDPRLYMSLLEPCFLYSSPIYLVFKYLAME